MKVIALLTCHNRKDLTLRCLEAFFSQTVTAAAPTLEAVVVDDGSTDGTGEAVRSAFGSSTRVIAGDGTLFWARGMQLAESRAIGERPDFLLWLNDDVTLEVGALDQLLATAATCTHAIIVGALLDPETNVVNVLGRHKKLVAPVADPSCQPSDRPVEADTFNGNVVLVPREVYERVGSIDGRFSHGAADFDYGLRARQAGFQIIVAPGIVGVCRRGGQHGTFRDPTLSLGRRWQLVQGAKGLPMRSHARYLRRHGGRLWPVFWLTPYLKLSVSALAIAVRRQLSRGR